MDVPNGLTELKRAGAEWTGQNLMTNFPEADHVLRVLDCLNTILAAARGSFASACPGHAG